MSDNLVTVVIPTFNKGEYIEMTLNSVLNQTYSSIEVLLVDNGSTDDTRRKIDSFQFLHPKIFRVIALNDNLGPSNARNIGILEAKGKYIFLLDGDDLLMPEKIEKQVKYMDDNPGLGLSLTPYLIYSSARRFSIRLVRELDPRKLVRGWIGMSSFGGLVESTGCIRRSFLEAPLLFDLTLMGSEGLDLTIRWLNKFPIGVLHEPLTVYRISSNQLHYDVSAISENMTRVTNVYFPEEVDRSKLLAQQAAFFRLDRIRHRSKFVAALYLSRSVMDLNLLNVKMAWWILSRNVKSVIFGFLFRGKVNFLLDSLSSGKTSKL